MILRGAELWLRHLEPPKWALAPEDTLRSQEPFVRGAQPPSFLPDFRRCVILKSKLHGHLFSRSRNVSQSRRLFHNGRHRDYRGTRPRRGPWHDRQFLHVSFAGSTSHSRLRFSRSPASFLPQNAAPLRRQHSSRRPAGALRVFRETRTDAGRTCPARHSLSLDRQRHSAAGQHPGTVGVQRRRRTPRGRSHNLHRRSGINGEPRWRTFALSPRPIPASRSVILLEFTAKGSEVNSPT